MQAKFRRLMGIKDGGNAPTGQEGPQAQGQQLMDDLEKEFERSRAFQLSRGAGGKSGIGLGYSGTWRRLAGVSAVSNIQLSNSKQNDLECTCNEVEFATSSQKWSFLRMT